MRRAHPARLARAFRSNQPGRGVGDCRIPVPAAGMEWIAHSSSVAMPPDQDGTPMEDAPEALPKNPPCCGDRCAERSEGNLNGCIVVLPAEDNS